MPSSEAIVDGLTAIARDAWPFAVVWHVIIALALIAVARGFRPTHRTASFALIPPLVSVSAFAGAYGNAFNAIVFGAGAMSLLVVGIRLSRQDVHRAPPALVVVGVCLMAFGWVYPHFLEHRSPLVYLYAAPTGLVPCPTLSFVIGVAILADGFRSRAWSTNLGMMGLFYGLFGAFRLGVTIDIALAAGACVLLGAVWLRRPGGEVTGRGWAG